MHPLWIGMVMNYPNKNKQNDGEASEEISKLRRRCKAETRAKQGHGNSPGGLQRSPQRQHANALQGSSLCPGSAKHPGAAAVHEAAVVA